jgi:very-short-patch-repair endonuclease
MSVRTDRIAAQDVRSFEDVLLTSAARTVVDLARYDGAEQGLVAAEWALARQYATRDQLLEVMSRSAQWPGIRRVEAVVTEADQRAESVFESVSRWRLARSGLPRPEIQAELGPYRVDFLWRAHRTIGEADGMAKYLGADAAPEQVRELVRAEKKRHSALVDAGWEVVRWLWDEIWFTPEVVSERVRAAFARAARA